MFSGEEAARRRSLLAAARAWAAGGVDFIQIREKDLAGWELLALAREVVAVIREMPGIRTKVLLNGPAEMALEAGCDGVHLTGSAGTRAAEVVRAVFADAGRRAFVSRSCHAPEEAARAEADLILFAPVFEKILDRAGERVLAGSGLDALGAACRATASPVLALGGVTVENAPTCVASGAAGVAAIRLFAGDDWQLLRTE